MRIEHIALRVRDLENMKSFYTKYFQGESNEKYVNKKKKFESYFIKFETGARLELIRIGDTDFPSSTENLTGFMHIAFSAGSKENVDSLTKLLVKEGYQLLDGPRTTGDGYYESVILDPEDNRVEITI